MEPEKPRFEVVPIQEESIGPADSHVVGPYIPMDRKALVYLEHLVGTDQQAARDFVGELLARLERAGATEV
jgi:hypothetical protein